MSVFVGLDCGGSSSRVLAIDSSGEIVYQGQSGAANLASTPEVRFKRNLEHATEGCPHADYVCGCFAGLVSAELRRRGEECLRHLFLGASVRAEPDYTAALYAAPAGTDICVIAGTGSLVCSRGPNGIVKSGGRGYILGDEGSGFHYGRSAVQHYLANPSQASPVLRDLIREVFGTTEEGEIVAQVYKSGMAAAYLGKMAKALVSDARSGEEYALESIRTNSLALAQIVAAHTQRYLPGRESLQISLSGGMWKASPLIREAFEGHLHDLIPGPKIELTRVNRPPLYGAVELARELCYGN